jgi:hypothetical protein
MRDPSLSSPTTLHAFRIVFFDAKRGIWAARDAGRGITRISKAALEEVLDGAFNEDGLDGSIQNEMFAKTVQRVRPHLTSEANEEHSMKTLEDLKVRDGDIFDIVMKSSSQGGAAGSERSRTSFASHPNNDPWVSDRAQGRSARIR